MRLLITYLLCFASISVNSQTLVELFSGMDGLTISEDGSLLPYWGYGYLSEGQMSLPAPLLTFDLGEDVELYFENPSPESHTIHLHGLDVDQANDGVPSTSFMVPFGGSGSYFFEATFPGTYLYHCHVTTTLHLTMGMYGMIVINYSDDQLFEEGPMFDKEYPFLFSDCERAVNDFPAGAFPFHEIRPDYFMVNGKSGTQLEDASGLQVIYEEGDDVALRLGNIGYSKVVVQFESEHNAVAWMSDGRELPEPISLSALEIYPGERFSVIIAPNNGTTTPIEVEYYSMVNRELESVNSIPLIIDDSFIDENNGQDYLTIYPNPGIGLFHFESKDGGILRVLASDGREVLQKTILVGKNQLDFSQLSPGTYLIKVNDHPSQELIITDR